MIGHVANELRHHKFREDRMPISDFVHICTNDNYVPTNLGSVEGMLWFGLCALEKMNFFCIRSRANGDG